MVRRVGVRLIGGLVRLLVQALGVKVTNSFAGGAGGGNKFIFNSLDKRHTIGESNWDRSCEGLGEINFNNSTSV